MIRCRCLNAVMYARRAELTSELHWLPPLRFARGCLAQDQPEREDLEAWVFMPLMIMYWAESKLAREVDVDDNKDPEKLKRELELNDLQDELHVGLPRALLLLLLRSGVAPIPAHKR